MEEKKKKKRKGKEEKERRKRIKDKNWRESKVTEKKLAGTEAR